MTYPDDIMQAAREDAIGHFCAGNAPLAAVVRAGALDSDEPVQMWAKVRFEERMAERRRCADVVAAERDREDHRQGEYGEGYLAACEKLHDAIMAEHEIALSFAEGHNAGPVTRVTGAGPTIEAAIDAAAAKLERGK